MKTTFTRFLFGTLILLSVSATTVFAETEDKNSRLTLENKSLEFMQEGSGYSVDVQYGDTKGSVISTAIGSISDEGKGTISIMLQTLAHESCDRIKQVAYLERWDADRRDWVLVKSYEFVEVLEDQPNGRLPYLINEITLSGQKIGSMYRLRSTHTVTLKGNIETLRTETDGITLGK